MLPSRIDTARSESGMQELREKEVIPGDVIHEKALSNAGTG